MQKALEEWRKLVFREGIIGYLKDPSTQKIIKGEQMSTEILNPVTQPSMLYPALYGVRPRRKDYICRWCKSDNRSRLALIAPKQDDVIFGMTCDWCDKWWFASAKLILNETMKDQLDRIANFTKKTGKEFGALILRTEKGIILDMVQIGEGRSIEFAPTRELRSDEEILGSWHAHPISNEPSFWDIGSFLRDKWEKISCVSGAEGALTVMIKTDETVPLSADELENWEKTNREADTPIEKIAEQYKFLLYQGTLDALKLVGGEEKTTTLENLMNGVRGTKDLGG